MVDYLLPSAIFTFAGEEAVSKSSDILTAKEAMKNLIRKMAVYCSKEEQGEIRIEKMELIQNSIIERFASQYLRSKEDQWTDMIFISAMKKLRFFDEEAVTQNDEYFLLEFPTQLLKYCYEETRQYFIKNSGFDIRNKSIYLTEKGVLGYPVGEALFSEEVIKRYGQFGYTKEMLIGG